MFGEQALTGVAAISIHEVLQTNREIGPALQRLCAIRRGEGKILLKNVLWKVSFRTGKRFMNQRKEVVGVVKGFILSVFCGCFVTSYTSFQRWLFVSFETKKISGRNTRTFVGQLKLVKSNGGGHGY